MTSPATRPPPEGDPGAERRATVWGGIALGFVVLSLLALVVVPMRQGQRTESLRREISTGAEPARALSSEMQTSVARMVSAMRGYTITRDSQYIALYHRAHAEYDAARRALQALAPALDPEVSRALPELQRAVAAWQALPEELLGQGVAPVDFAARLNREQERYAAAVAAADRVEEALARAIARRRAAIRDAERQGLTATSILAGIALLAALVVAGLTVRLRRLSIDTGRLYDETRELASELRNTVIELQERTAQVEAADRSKSEFLATMSHELRTPLNAIIGYADLLELGVPQPLPEQPLAQVKRIDESARHLLRIIEEILTFSRMEAQQERVTTELVPLRAVIRSAVDMTQPLARRKGLQFTCDLEHAPELIRSDAGKLRQILLNLLGNAIKFTDSGRVDLTVVQQGGHVILRVSDTGIGIRPEDLPRIFDAFWQVDQSHTRQAGGTGLGLTVSRSLARLLGGELSASSVPGQGSTFELRLPAAEAAASGYAATA